MLIYKQRYKPRTTREFTKSDLTVYDSADNTALNALTVYGKSEVVDNEIVSAGDSGSIEIRTSGKNLFGGNFNEIYQIFIPANTTFTISTSITQPGEYPRIRVYDKSKTIIDYWNINSKSNSRYYRTFTLLYDVYYVQIYSITTSDIQLEFNATMSAYEPYNGTMAVFETGTPLRGIPDSDIRDVMAWDGSAGEVTKNCAKVRLADLTWVYYSPSTVFVATDDLNLPVKLGGYKGICPDYNVVDVGDLPNMAITISNSLFSGNPRIGLKNTNYTTVEDFVASLGDAELVYELATPTTEQLTSTENASIAGLRTFEPQTHAQNNAQTDMAVDYTIRVPAI